MFYLILSGAPIALIIANLLAVITVFLVVMPLHSVAVAGCTCLLRAQTKMTHSKFSYNPFVHQGLFSIIALLLFNFAWATSSYMDTLSLRHRKKRVLICPISAYAVHGICVLVFALALAILTANTDVTYSFENNMISIGGSYNVVHNFLGMYFYSMIHINFLIFFINLLPLMPFDGYYFLRAFAGSGFREKVRKIADIVVISLFVIFLTTIPQRFLFPYFDQVYIKIIEIVSGFVPK